MTKEERAKELDAFYAFVEIFGYGYLTEEGLIHFNALRGEWASRTQEEQVTTICPDCPDCIPDETA